MAGYSPGLNEGICPGISYIQREIDYVYVLKVYYVITIIYIYVIPPSKVRASSWSAGNHPGESSGDRISCE